jgi:hypothetical protein
MSGKPGEMSYSLATIVPPKVYDLKVSETVKSFNSHIIPHFPRHALSPQCFRCQRTTKQRLIISSLWEYGSTYRFGMEVMLEIHVIERFDRIQATCRKSIQGVLPEHNIDQYHTPGRRVRRVPAFHGGARYIISQRVSMCTIYDERKPLLSRRYETGRQAFRTPLTVLLTIPPCV